ncbi:hypothetical protein LCGC14_1049480 [marine sediment metagenome]|uniref:Right handed beta helix domain-containing protein n=1 Tax=marine sediment metagenome TaxID=412755 RepID=A0A0F9MPB3_9ZZZZ
MATELTPRELTAELAALKRQLADQDEVVQRALSIASHHAPEHFFEGNDALRPHIAVRLNSGATEVGRRPRLNFLDTETGEWTLAEGTTEGEDEIDISLKATGGGFGVCYDYLVMSGWTGTEGQTITIPDSTETFKVYSTIQAPIDDAVSDASSGKTYSIGICPGTYAENLTWPTTAITGIFLHGYDFISEDNFGEVYINPSSGHAITVTGNPKLISAENIVFGGQAGSSSINHVSGINWSGQFTHCEFRRSITNVDFTAMHFAHCKFASDVSLASVDDVYFHDCKFSDILDMKTNGSGVDNVTVDQCVFLGSNARILLGQRASNVIISANQFTTSGATANSRVEITPDIGDPLHHISIIGNAFTTGPLTNGQEILLDTSASSSNIWGVTITANTFSDAFTGSGLTDTCHIRLKGNSSGDIFGIVIANNVFGANNAQLDHIEDAGGFTVIGTFVEESVFGPSGRHNVVKYKITDGANNLFIPSSSDETGLPGSGRVSVEAHAILDGDVHTDSAADVVTRGSVIAANSTPAWDELVLGANHLFLGSDGADVLYRTVGWDVLLEPTGSSDAARIQTAIDAGSRKILLLDGTWDVSDQNVTFATGTEIVGQSRKATILDFGTTAFFQFLMAADTFVGNATVANAPTSASAPPIQTLAGYTMVWNIDFSSTSGSGLAIGRSTSARAHIINCIFQGLPDAAVGQIEIDAPRFAIIQNCGFLGAASSGAAIFNRHPATASEFFPRPNVVITGCYGTTNCGDGWLDDGGSARETTFSIVGNSIAQAGANAPFAIDISNAIALISGNSFIVPTGQATAAAMINVSGGKVMIENNRLDANSTRTDIIDISTGGHSVLGNLIRGTSTNAIHLTAGNNSVIGGNNCPSGDIRIAGGSTGHVVALNSVNAVVGDATLNQIGLNVTGA